MLNEDSDVETEKSAAQQEPTRQKEHGDVAEPDAPTAEKENEGMNTVLDADPVTGVQDEWYE